MALKTLQFSPARRDGKLTIPLRDAGSVEISIINNRTTQPGSIADIMMLIPGLGAYNVGESIAGMTDDIIVHRSNGVGDVICVTPVVRLLKQRYGKRVHMVTAERNVALFDGNPYIASVGVADPPMPHETTRIELDLTVENTEGRGIYIHRVDAFARCFDEDVTQEERHPDYYIKPQENTWACERLFQAFGTRVKLDGTEIKGVIAYIWRTSTDNRNFSDAKHHAVINALIAAGYGLVLLHDGAIGWIFDSAISPMILDMTGKCSMRETAALMYACDAVLTGDTGPFHLASALDAPTVAYFGAMPAEHRATHKYLEVLEQPALGNPSRCGNMPCRQYRCLHWRKDEVGMSPCLDIEPQAVIDAIVRVIARKREATLVIEKELLSNANGSDIDGCKSSAGQPESDSGTNDKGTESSDEREPDVPAGKGAGDIASGDIRRAPRSVLGREDVCASGQFRSASVQLRSSRKRGKAEQHGPQSDSV